MTTNMFRGIATPLDGINSIQDGAWNKTPIFQTLEPLALFTLITMLAQQH
jgi:hypothetical protein